MKRKVVCVLAFALFLMIACTMVSAKIEEEMLTQVVVYEVPPKQAGRFTINLPYTFIYLENDTVDLTSITLAPEDFEGGKLFQVGDGTGWEDGLRLQAVPEDEYWPDVAAGAIMGPDETRGWRFVNYASRFPQEGQKVELLTGKDKARERFLVLYPGRVPMLTRIPEGMTIAAQGEDLLPLEVEQSPQPFLQERAREQMKKLNVPGCRVYSLETAEALLGDLPAVAGVAVIFFAALVIWIQSLCLLEGDNRLLAVNALLGIGLLAALWQLLAHIDLPSALLPTDSILDWGYYREEFHQIFTALEKTREASLSPSTPAAGLASRPSIWPSAPRPGPERFCFWVPACPSYGRACP